MNNKKGRVRLTWNVRRTRSCLIGMIQYSSPLMKICIMPLKNES